MKRIAIIVWWTEPHIGRERTFFPLLSKDIWFRKNINHLLFPCLSCCALRILPFHSHVKKQIEQSKSQKING